METKGLTCKIPLDLHNRISEEMREKELTVSQYIELVIREHMDGGIHILNRHFAGKMTATEHRRAVCGPPFLFMFRARGAKSKISHSAECEEGLCPFQSHNLLKKVDENFNFTK